MDYLEPSYQHYSLHQEYIPTGLPSYADVQAHAMHNYAMAQQAAMLPMSHQGKNETKPRLGKDEVEILEEEFRKNPKPTTQTKKGFAEEMGVDLPRINNWFQNRRAKRKQENKQRENEDRQAQESQGTSEPSSPDDFDSSNSYYNNNNLTIGRSATFPMANGSLHAAAAYNPQYSNPANASMESLHRTLVAAQAGQNASQQDFHTTFLDHNEPLSGFGGSLLQGSSSNDRAQFPSSSDSVSPFDNSHGYSYPSTYTNSICQPPQPMLDFQHSAEVFQEQTPVQFNTLSSPESSTSMPLLVATTFPSELLPTHDSHASNDSSDSQSPEDDDLPTFAFELGYEIQNSDESSLVPPPSSLPFRAPPRPMDIASRRKKVQVKPTALVADTRGRPQLGPRTVSHADGFRRQSDSPMASPRRRIASAGGNRNGISGRIQKPTFDMAQRSPLNLNGFADTGSFMEHNYQNFHYQPPMTAGSSMSSSLAPPTPLSPREQEMSLVKVEGCSRSTASPTDGSMTFIYNPATFSSVDGDQNLASPPETPQAQFGGSQSSNGWPSVEFEHKSFWDVCDEPEFTPAQESFPSDVHQRSAISEPSYLAISQPVTPAFGQFNANIMYRNDSPQLQSESPTYALNAPVASEYTFPESQTQFSMGMLTASMGKPKSFQFSNSTAADFSEK